MNTLDLLNKIISTHIKKNSSRFHIEILMNKLTKIDSLGDIKKIDHSSFRLNSKWIINLFVESVVLIEERTGHSFRVDMSRRKLEKIKKMLNEAYQNKIIENKSQELLKKIELDELKFTESKVGKNVLKINKLMFDLIKDNELFSIDNNDANLELSNYPSFLIKINDHYKNINLKLNKIKDLYFKLDKTPPELKKIIEHNYNKTVIYTNIIQRDLVNHSTLYLEKSQNFINNLNII